MTSAMWLRNLGAVTIQAGVLVVAGAVLARALRIEAPRAALIYWRALLVVCLLLPLCQPWHITAPPSATVTLVPSSAERIPLTTSEAAVPPARTWPTMERLVVAALGTGLAVRGLWLVLGAWVLGRIRRDASRLDPVPPAIARAQDRVGVTASLYVCGRIAGPITFGVRRPVIVFPPGIAALDSSTQYAIACHELLHIRRHDWVFQVVEESIRTVLWFHPGVWWLIDRIHLTREQVEDQEAVALLESRER
jgi:bla regulator protein BlaR1